MNETIKTIITRRSIRSFKPDPIEKEKLDAILEAGTYAPTAMGRQAPVMVVVTDPDMIDKMEKINARFTAGEHPFYGAKTVIVVLADTRLSANNAMQDGSLVMGNLMLAAHSLGVDSCWINRATETFKTPEGIELLKKWGLDENFVGVGNCVLGYRDCEYPEPKPRKKDYVIWD